MKNLFLFLVFAWMISCHRAEVTPASTNNTFDPSKATLVKQGEIVGIGHTAMGTAKIYVNNTQKVVLLDPFSSQNGPDLKVYLSKDIDASDYIRLGALKAVSGSQSYDIPGKTDLDQYHYVHIWCEKFTVVFARAEVK